MLGNAKIPLTFIATNVKGGWLILSSQIEFNDIVGNVLHDHRDFLFIDEPDGLLILLAMKRHLLYGIIKAPINS